MKEVIKFHLASVTLTDIHKQVLKNFIDNNRNGKKVIISGHACDTPVVTEASLAKFKDNMGFSSARAQEVSNEIVNLGVSPSDIEMSYHGDTKPVDSNKDNNRRVEIEIV